MRKLHELSTVGKSEPESPQPPGLNPETGFQSNRAVPPHHISNRPMSARDPVMAKPTPESIRPGGLRGRCWIRTNVGETDGFTDRSLWPLGQPAVLALTSDR
jgi:hypothetical protein